jgi:DNA-binding winged helix-turn-helix (wHTH) protein/TolB-like protein/Tfp pilus assembly protein PilF
MKNLEQVLPSGYQFDDVVVDLPNFRLTKGGVARALTPRAFDVLLYLIEQRVVEKQELFDRIWKETFVTDSALAREIKEIRRALADDAGAPRYIETVPKRGYRFIAKISQPERQGPEAKVFGLPVPARELEVAAEEAAEPVPAGLLKSFEWRRPGLLLGVAVVLVVGVLLVTFGRLRRKTPGSLVIQSLAVLPFRPVTGEVGNEILEIGLADVLITRLGRANQLIVRPTSSVRKFAKPEQDPLAAGRELQVDVVLDSNIALVGDRLRVTFRLLNVEDGRTLWADQIDEKSRDVFALQDAITGQVASALMPKLTGSEREALSKGSTRNPEALRLYLQGQLFLDRRSSTDAERSRQYFQRAIDLDPQYALAHSGLAQAYHGLFSASAFPPNEVVPKARAEALRALELEPTLPEGHIALAQIMMGYDWAWSDAERELKQAIQLNRNSAMPHMYFGVWLLMHSHFDEALTEIRRAAELDPLSSLIQNRIGMGLYFARRYDEAIQQCLKTLDLDSKFRMPYEWMGRARYQMGQNQQALDAFLKRRTLDGWDTERLAALRHAYQAFGWKGYWSWNLKQALEQQTARHSYVNPESIAELYARLGEKKHAIEWLQKAVDEHAWGLLWMKVNPAWDPLRNDPHFKDLLRRVGPTL